VPDSDGPGPHRPRARGGRRAPLAVSVVDERGRPASRSVAAWLRRVAPARARGAVAIALVSDARMKALNRTYRGKDAVTDVLSFPWAGSQPKLGNRQSIRDPQSKIQNPSLGDIAIARGVAGRQARAAGHDLAAELKILALHGLLHLLGYDHERDNGQMHRVELRLRRKGGLREGLIERAAR